MTNPICLLSSSDSSSSDLSVSSPAIKKPKTTFAASSMRFSSDDDSDSEIPTTSIFSKPNLGNLQSLSSHASAYATAAHFSSSDESLSGIEGKIGNRSKKKPLKPPDRSREQQLVRTERRRHAEQEQQRRRKEKEMHRETQRKERELQRNTLKQCKVNRKLMAQQMTGKFAKEEVGLLMHSALKQGWPGEAWDMFNKACPNVFFSEGIEKGAIHFLRRDYLAGGAKFALEAYQDLDTDGYQLLDRIMIVFSDPDDFLKLLDRSEEEDDYPLLEAWLDDIYNSWSINFNASNKPRIVLLLPRLIDVIRRHWNTASQAQRLSLVTEADINDAIVWLHVAFCVECQILKSDDQVLDFITDMTRAISEVPYVQQVTELDCVRKLKSNVPSTAPPLERAHDVWIRMLQQIPGISAARAEQLAQSYPTASSLWEAYQNPNGSTAEDNAPDGSNESWKAHLVANMFGERAQLKKLSEHVFRTMTSDDRNELLR